MLDNMSSNQRLLLAVALSIVFFIGYSAIFPPKQTQAQKDIAQNHKENTLQHGSEKVTSDTRAHNVESVPAKPEIGHSVSADENIAKDSTNTLVSIDSQHFSIKIDTLGRISSKILKDEKYNDKEGNPIQMVPQNGAKPLYIRFSDSKLNEEAAKTPYRSDVKQVNMEGSSLKVVLTQELSSVNVNKEITFYQDGHYDVKVNLSEDKRYFIYLGQHAEHKGQMMMAVHGAMVYTGNDLVTIFEDGDTEGRSTFNDVSLASAFDQYFASIFYSLRPDTSVIIERDRDNNPIVYIDAGQSISFSGYIGPKDYKVLQNIDPVLTNAIEYGWFTFISAPMFKVLMWLEGMFGNWGWAIIALTIIIRMMLYPLTYRGMLSMQRMKELAPKIKELREKHKGDPQRLNAATMELYKKHSVNPLGGCMPMLLQIPVFFAIYRVLLNAVELQGAPWMFWIQDLSRMDPTYILPILMGATMYYQQKITPSNFTDPMQEKVFKFLPVIFTFFFVTFPSGLVLYWFVNNLFSIAQQYIVNRKFEAAKAARHEKHLVEKHHDKD
ncbi:MAG: membrane protein insertase YidC [Helicobacteraceae bacterium 4484_230]|nr:MAG: membrane protein insertase YidC [Helicobacteraceae bacterium 4484_230]